MNNEITPRGLQLPYALSDLESLVSANDAIKGQQYHCPNCRDAVTLRRGEERAAHFAHRPGTGCNTESAIHKIAKRLIADTINLNATSSDRTITIVRECEHCGQAVDQLLPAKTFTSADEEVRIGEYRCDAVGYRESAIALGVEIRHTHAVDDVKSGSLAVPWIELDAQAVIANPFRWEALASRLKTALCGPCKNEVKSIVQAATRWKIPRHLYSPVFNPDRSQFIAGKEACWKCKNVIPVFWWKGVPFAETAPPEPRPPTIQFRYSKQFGGKYWANTCPQCKSTQGDNFLFLFDNGPLRSSRLPLRHIPGVHGDVTISTGPGAVNEFINKVFGKYP
ncbi:hypothetical protein RE428_48640 (plasmid) [Marinobacter nanhaiticus D15-8W]|nr:competence protein CoiA family protein [Marinobacter nanhaiticus]BES73846.1 hypothetical protein RE428_48640 [Marinobacter nanhaiticus D15-8W]